MKLTTDLYILRMSRKFGFRHSLLKNSNGVVFHQPQNTIHIYLKYKLNLMLVQLSASYKICNNFISDFILCDDPYVLYSVLDI
jgi:hypothetical protein